jgi:hypothetical protein
LTEPLSGDRQRPGVLPHSASGRNFWQRYAVIKVANKTRAELVSAIIQLKFENERLYGENERLRMEGTVELAKAMLEIKQLRALEPKP